MFEFAGLARRNPAWVTRNAREAWAVSKAMKAFRLLHPYCAWCGRADRIQVHHIEPVSVAPEKAADPQNMVSLCGKRCHLTIGHSGDYGGRYVPNVSDVCALRQVHRITDMEM